jgi:TatD DNase family protein
MLYAGVGLHPMDLPGPVTEATLEALRSLAAHPKAVVWSETGLDYLPTSPPRDLQHDAFRAQIRLAKELKLPLVVHSREAHQDTLRLLREEHAEDAGGAWHYFQGDLATAQAVLDLGFYVSLAKPLLRLPDLQQVAAQLPLDRIVLETDSYPQPFKKHRERWTEPAHLPQVAAKLAELHATTVERVAEATTANALHMLRGRLKSAPF